VSLVSAASVFSEFAFVNYNAVLPRVSTPNNIGKISGLGWSAGYLGGVLALGVVLWGFVLEPNGLRLSTDDAFNIRAVALFSAFWCLVFCLPLLVRMRRRERFLPEVLPVRELKFLERGFTRLSPARRATQPQRTGCEENPRALGGSRAAALVPRSRRCLTSLVVAFHPRTTCTMLSAPMRFEQNNPAGTSPMPGNQSRKALL